MNKLSLLLITTFLSFSAFAQMQRNAMPAVSRSELAMHLGFVAGAANIGVDYNLMENNAGIGGYFFYQTEKKDKGVNKIMSFGASYKVNVLNTSRFTGYLSPGFGIHMVTIPASGTRSESTENAFGPVYKIGTLFKVSPTFQLGLERQALVNWFNDVVYSQEIATYSVSAVLSF